MKSGGLAFIKIIIAVLAVFTVVVIGYQMYQYHFVSIKTESAVMGEIEETVSGTGIFFRNEEVIESGGYSYLDVVRAEGERVSADGVIARVYSNEQSAKRQKELRALEERISTYEDVLANSGSYVSASQGIDRNIYDNLEQIAANAHRGDSLNAFENADTLILNIMKHKIAAGDLVSYDALLDELRREYASLRAGMGDSLRTIYSPESGCFSLATDGLEQKLTPDVLTELTVENFADAEKLCDDAAGDDRNVGKMVYDNTWSVAMKLETRAVGELEPGNTVYIRIPSFGPDRIKCTVADLRKSGEECVLVLTSAIISNNILTLRKEDIYLVLKTHRGIQVRQSALRKVNGEDGVFVKVGLLLRYKKVEILYNDGTNVILNYVATNESGIRIYDQVVYKGSNLYDGKAVS